jgi:hypothetical protein
VGDRITHRGGDELVGVGADGSADDRGAAGRRRSAGAAAGEQAGGWGAEHRRRHRHGFGLVEGVRVCVRPLGLARRQRKGAGVGGRQTRGTRRCTFTCEPFFFFFFSF